jgi:hypothetical protein
MTRIFCGREASAEIFVRLYCRPMLPGARQASLGIAVILAALLVFYVRGPERARTDSGDFATLYGAARCWIFRSNPYLHSDVLRQYLVGGGDPAEAPDQHGGASIYPPTTFPLAAIVAWLDWETAKRVWLTISVFLFAASLACVARSEFVTNLGVGSAVIALLLLFSPVHTGIAKGQPSVVCISMLVCAFYWKPARRREIVSGLLLGLSCCLKPNVGLPYLLFCCWRRQWRVVAVSAAVILPIAIVGVTRLQMFSPGWQVAWADNIQSATAPTGTMNPAITNSSSFLLVNFQTLIGFFTVNQALCNWLTYALLGGLLIWVIRVAKPDTDPWLPLALFSLLVLLGSYHRYYDLQLLMLGTNGVLQVCRRYWKPYFWATLVVPGTLLWFPLQALAVQYMLPPDPTAPVPFPRSLLLFLAFRNQPICLSLLTLSLALVILKKSSRESSYEVGATVPRPRRS